MAAAVVHDPVDTAGGGAGFGGHDLGQEPVEGLDAGGGLAAAEDPGAVHVPGGQVLQRAAPGVLDLGAGRAPGAAGSEA